MASEFEESSKFEGSPKLSTNSEPVAWQWLDTAHFRKIVPAGAEVEVWRPLYAHPAPSVEPCPYIRSSAEGTHWCALAEQPTDHRAVMRLEDERSNLLNVMQQALDTLSKFHCSTGWGDDCLRAVNALRAALGDTK
jgi:hypothetical protein